MKATKGNGTLPRGAMRVVALVERSAPDPTRPRLSNEWEQKLAPVDAMSAACYASMEDLTDQLAQLATTIADVDAVVVDEASDEDSLVIHLNEAQDKLIEPLPPVPNAGNGRLVKS